MTATEAGTSEFDRFGPWVDEVETPADVPPLFRSHPMDLDAATLVLKFPRNIARRDANPDMDLYDHLLVLDERAVTVLSRRARGADGAGFDVHAVALGDVVAVRTSVSILDGVVTVLARDGSELSVRYSGSARENIRRLVDLLRAAVSRTDASAAGAALLRSGRASADAGAALALGRADQSLVSHVRDVMRHVPGLMPWVGHGQRRAARADRGVAGVLQGVAHAMSPMTLHGAVIAGDDGALEVFGRHQWLVRGRAPVLSGSRLVLPFGAIDAITVAPHPRYAGATVATAVLGAGRVELILPSGTAAHALLSGVARRA